MVGRRQEEEEVVKGEKERRDREDRRNKRTDMEIVREKKSGGEKPIKNELNFKSRL